MKRTAINGLGRIGRMRAIVVLLRILFFTSNIEWF
jgi:glyceraldehyde-3-phosphate dehydrogenase/erythrose-4-phosphate dehydrogenase